MNSATVGLPVSGMTPGVLRRAVALSVTLVLLMTAGARIPASALEMGRLVSVVVSKLDPRDPRPERTVERMGGEVGRSVPIVEGFEAKVPERGLERLAETPNVRGLVRNNTVRFHGQYGENSGVASSVYTDVTRASKAWSAGYTGNGVNVAVIDTGVDVSGDLAGRVLHAVDFSGEDAPHQDSFGHGTFVAGVIAGTGASSGGAVKGVAPGAGIVSIKIAGRDGSTNVFRLLAAIEWAVTHKDAYGIRVVNLSLGSDSTQSYLVDPLNFAVERMWNAGIVVVTAAGNKGSSSRTIVKPADDPLVVTVGASDDKTTLTRTDDAVPAFSSVGPTASNGIAKPDVVAPGKSVVSTRAPGSFIEAAYPNAVIGSSYFKGSGTSFSAGVVSGTAALVIQRSWKLNPNQVKHRLMSTAKPLPNVSSASQGTGQIDAYNAVISDDLTAANQGVVAAAGGGSLQGSSGSACYRDANGNCVSDAEVNAAIGFDPNAYFGSPWAGNTWNGSQWGSSLWLQSQWNGSQWGGSQWGGSQWGGSQWGGSQWGGSQWGGSQWGGSQWGGSQWGGSQWGGSQWGGLEWAGNHWT